MTNLPYVDKNPSQDQHRLLLIQDGEFLTGYKGPVEDSYGSLNRVDLQLYQNDLFLERTSNNILEEVDKTNDRVK